MAPKEEQKKGNVGKGFAGLSSMISDVDASIRSADQSKPNSSGGSAAGTERLPPKAPPAQEPEPAPPYQVAKKQQSGGSSAGKWLLGVGLIIGFLWLVSVINGPPSPRQSQQAPDRNRLNQDIEEMPPVGTNLVLAPAQLRYCLSEAIRLDAARTAMNNYVQSDVSRFNAMIDNYNGRCGSFRYRKGALERNPIRLHRILRRRSSWRILAA